MRCPDHPRDLNADGACPFCAGALLEGAQLEALSAGALGQLSVEGRDDSPAFARVRVCPSCAVPMAPLRIGLLEAWVEKCPQCERYWVERSDRPVLARVRVRTKLERSYQALPEAERKELARDLAVATGEDPDENLSPVQAVLSVVGIPMVSRTRGNRLPYATWGLCGALVLVYGLGLGLPETFGVQALGMDALAPTLGTAFSASFVHFGAWHLFGNVGFLFAFGDGVEQWIPRPALLALFTLLGAAALGTEAMVSSGHALIAGASGGVAAVMGACLVLQPRARVLYLLRLFPLRVPLPLYCALWLLLQAVMAAAGVPGVAWMAHLTGFALGVAAGGAVRWQRRQPALA